MAPTTPEPIRPSQDTLSGFSLLFMMAGLTLGSTHSLRADAAQAASLARLKAGSAHFVSGRLEHPNLSSERRAELTRGAASRGGDRGLRGHDSPSVLI